MKPKKINAYGNPIPKPASAPAGSVARSVLRPPTNIGAPAPKVAPRKEGPELPVHAEGLEGPMGLTFKETCTGLKPQDRLAAARFLPNVPARGRRTKLPGAEEAAVDAALCAVDSFCPELAAGKTHGPGMTLEGWIAMKVRFAQLNLAAQFPVDKVRDAVLEFKQRFGHLPNLSQLCKFSRLGPRQVLNVWLQVADELDIARAMDPIMGLLEIGQTHRQPPTPGFLRSVSEERVRRILVLLTPRDACILILFLWCELSEMEVLEFLDRARAIWMVTHDEDAVEALYECLVKDLSPDLLPPWDQRLLKYHTKGPLRVALCRAKERFHRLYVREFGMPM